MALGLGYEPSSVPAKRPISQACGARKMLSWRRLGRHALTLATLAALATLLPHAAAATELHEVRGGANITWPVLFYILQVCLALRMVVGIVSVLDETPTDVFEMQANNLPYADIWLILSIFAVLSLLVGMPGWEEVLFVVAAVIVEAILILQWAKVYKVRGVLKPLRESYGRKARHLIGSCTTLSERAVDRIIKEYEDQALPSVRRLGFHLCFRGFPGRVKSEFYLDYISGLVSHFEQRLWDGVIDLLASWVKEQVRTGRVRLRVESDEMMRNYADKWTAAQFLVRCYLLSAQEDVGDRERYCGVPQVFTRSTEAGFHTPQGDIMWARRSHIEVQLRADEGTDHEAVSRVGPCVQQDLLEHWIRVGTIRRQGEMRMYAHDGKIAIDPEFWNASCQGVVNSFRHITSSAWVAGWPKFGIDNNSSAGRTFHQYTQGVRLNMTAIVRFVEEGEEEEGARARQLLAPAKVPMEVFRQIEDVFEMTVARDWSEPSKMRPSIAAFIILRKCRDWLKQCFEGMLMYPASHRDRPEG
eukprot:evm.model.scf_379.9 EVM.evm.TU.scf_379.9   scf_379:59452-62332(-)